MRGLTLDVLKELPEKHLSYSVGPNMGTLGKQFRHIGDVQLCYTEALKTGKISFDHYRRDYSLEKSQQKLLAFLREVDQEFLSQIKKKSSPEREPSHFRKVLGVTEHRNEPYLKDTVNKTRKSQQRNFQSEEVLKIDWFGEKWGLDQHLQALIEHEILHHGQLVVYLRTLDLKFPQSWEIWGL
jgi:uncharacterized damage-inducible protein DinB